MKREKVLPHLKIFILKPTNHLIKLIQGLTEIINDIEKEDYMKSLTPIPFSQSNEYLEMSPRSVESQTSCRSHDGVFLRPGEHQKKSLR